MYFLSYALFALRTCACCAVTSESLVARARVWAVAIGAQGIDVTLGQALCALVCVCGEDECVSWTYKGETLRQHRGRVWTERALKGSPRKYVSSLWGHVDFEKAVTAEMTNSRQFW